MIGIIGVLVFTLFFTETFTISFRDKVEAFDSKYKNSANILITSQKKKRIIFIAI